jgi:hypothetical protein
MAAATQSAGNRQKIAENAFAKCGNPQVVCPWPLCDIRGTT